MAPLRISAISFLNTAPLMWDFEHGEQARELSRHFELSYTLPSHCAEQLQAGTADIGIIPVAAYTAIPDRDVVPDVRLAATDHVRWMLWPDRGRRSTSRASFSSRATTASSTFRKLFRRGRPGWTCRKNWSATTWLRTWITRSTRRTWKACACSSATPTNVKSCRQRQPFSFSSSRG